MLLHITQQGIVINAAMIETLECRTVTCVDENDRNVQRPAIEIGLASGAFHRDIFETGGLHQNTAARLTPEQTRDRTFTNLIARMRERQP
jgi:hypothetical protein